MRSVPAIRACMTVLLLTPAACSRTSPGDSAAAAAGTAPAREIVIRGRDMAFTAPASIPSGRTTFRFINDGPNLHHMQLLRLEEGKTIADFGAAMQGGALPPWATFVGGPNVSSDSAGSVATLDLEAGNYVLLCFIDTPDHVPHFAKGMVQPLTVTPATGTMVSAPLPPADLTITLTDFAFTLSDSLRAGPQEVDVTVPSGQPHEVVFLRLNPGKTAADIAAWAATYEGPIPATTFGGTTAIAAGQRQRIKLDLVPGDYLLICFVPDATDGKPHVAHGMVHQFTIS